MSRHSAMRLSGDSYAWRCIMAVSVQPSPPIVPFPVVLGVLRRLEVATVMAHLIPPHPAHGLSWGRGVEALGLALRDGPQALDKRGRRRAARGMGALWQPGLTRVSRTADRWGPLLGALLAAQLNPGLRAVALPALAG